MTQIITSLDIAVSTSPSCRRKFQRLLPRSSRAVTEAEGEDVRRIHHHPQPPPPTLTLMEMTQVLNASQASSVLSEAASPVASISSQPTLARKRAKKTQFCLNVQEEQIMCNFLRENTILWDIKKTDYRRVDKKAKLWEDQATAMEKTGEYLQGWFKSLRDTHTRLDKKKSGDGAPELTEREQWVKANFGFLKPVVRHRPDPVNSVKATIAAHSGDLEAAEAACADIVVDDDSTPSPVPSASSQGKGKRGQDDDPLLQSPQKRLHESGEILKGLTQPQPITATAAFANYVRDSLVSMSQRKFRKARSRINAILSELMDEESD
ncbi:uncharacterized protein LOC129180119 [Dunckerocampus dactyliophorus]|uniref:uncharacterized protein LOC129180119 n=1 Tax=Dunckerocampus dactyliophorus TaxID=161453 RepID=UPI00240530F8|nr:uncharacterized protein LOC129180119 [Dunckerocampus dactyliophorus]XP_054630202.1 uncharacterized protein LOC129180119 [Dunckerocampus dactyliophorus]